MGWGWWGVSLSLYVPLSIFRFCSSRLTAITKHNWNQKLLKGLVSIHFHLSSGDDVLDIDTNALELALAVVVPDSRHERGRGEAKADWRGAMER